MSHPKGSDPRILEPAISDYLATLHGEPEPLVLEMERFAAASDFPLVGRQSGRWLELLTRMIGGRRVFELGSGWGYSAFWFARAVGEGGEVLGSELDPEDLAAHERLFANHPLKARIRIRQGDAFTLLDEAPGQFDAIFVDIHKKGYLEALERSVPRLRPGGLFLADNVLWGGRTARAPDPDDEDTAALQEFNRRLFSDPRLQAGILPACDGLAVALKLG